MKYLLLKVGDEMVNSSTHRYAALIERARNKLLPDLDANRFNRNAVLSWSNKSGHPLIP